MKSVIKRTGEKVPFEIYKIEAAIQSAMTATVEPYTHSAGKIATCVINELQETGENEPTVEKVQDLVEGWLFRLGYYATAKAYIRYRQQHEKIRENRKVLIDVEETMAEYLDETDWRTKENSNQSYSLGGLIMSGAGKLSANFWLSHVYPPEIGQAHRDGDFHIHDLSMLAPYCCGHSLRMLLFEGLNGVPGIINARPPKHLVSAVGQIVNFLGSTQNEWAGAQALSSVDTYLAPYVWMENLTYERVKQAMEELIYNLNYPSKWGGQTPFVNFSFDWTCPEDLKNLNPIIADKELPILYGDLQKEMGMINKAFIEVMTNGDASGKVFTFPIPTYNITKDFDWSSSNTPLLFEMTAKYGLPYFQNFVNSDLKPSDVRSMCCRLSCSVRELEKRGGGLFGSVEQTGSIGVVTINLARLGYLAKGRNDLGDRLDRLLGLAKESLVIKRKVLTRHLENGLYPFTKRFLGSFKNHFSTIGVNGAHEMCLNFGIKEGIASSEGRALATLILQHIRNKLLDFQEETGTMWNLEATPAEGTSLRFALRDKEQCPEIIQAGTEDAPYYTNSTQLPVNYTDDIVQVLDHQETLQQLYTGGTVQHIYLGERISAEGARDLIKRIFENYRIPYLSITPTFSTCPEHGYIVGERPICPKCGGETEIYTRVVGYIRPVKNFNIGKRSEFEERRTFKVE